MIRNIMAVAHAWQRWPHEVMDLSPDEIRLCVAWLNEIARD